MNTSSSTALNTYPGSVAHKPVGLAQLSHFGALLVWLLVLVGAVYGQTASEGTKQDEVIISGVTDSTVFGIGNPIRIKGTVKQGAIAFGNDVIVEGTVEGDVAAIGGSVIQ